MNTPLETAQTNRKREALIKIKEAIDKMIFNMPDCACENCRSFKVIQKEINNILNRTKKEKTIEQLYERYMETLIKFKKSLK